MWIDGMIGQHKYYCCQSQKSISFYHFSVAHNFKGAAVYHPNGNRSYCLNAYEYGDSFYGVFVDTNRFAPDYDYYGEFNNKSWRAYWKKYFKLLAFQ